MYTDDLLYGDTTIDDEDVFNDGGWSDEDDEEVDTKTTTNEDNDEEDEEDENVFDEDIDNLDIPYSDDE